MRQASLWAVVASAVVGGCMPSMGRGLGSRNPAEQMDAMLDAARRGDRSAVPQIVPFLQNDDPAVRLIAINTLERLTGQTLGYDYASPESEREEAVERWRRFVESDARTAGEPGVPGET